MKSKHASKTFFYLSICLFCVALSQPCFCTKAGCGEEFEGLAILITGGLGTFLFPAGVTWFANVTLLISWVTREKPKTSLIMSVITFCLALSFLFFKEVMVNEAGGMSKITGYQIGYCLWLGSSLAMLGSSIIGYLKFKGVEESPTEKAYLKPEHDEVMITGEWVFEGKTVHANEN